MLAALIIVFREVFEAGLIVGIVLAVTRSVAGRGWWVCGGIAGGLLGACVVAVFAGALSQLFEGAGQELFNAAILIIAVAMLTWHNVWMARHGREIAAEMRAAGEAVVSGSSSLAALAVVVGVAVLREGSEVVLFLYGILAGEGSTGFGIFLGGIGGLALGIAVCSLTYFGLLRIPGRYLFAATSLMIAFLAAGMASQAVLFLAQADVLTALGVTVWDTSWILSDGSVPGKALHTLIGYSDRPTEMQLIVYVATLVVTFALMKLFAHAPPQRSAAAA
jgi:high-affinity iron transporter